MSRRCFHDFIAYDVKQADGQLVAAAANGVRVRLAECDIRSCRTQRDFEQLLCGELSDKLGCKAASFGSYEMLAGSEA